MNPFVSHPSVRIKGTENNYEPSTCSEKTCEKNWPHMHCPFCVKTEVFQDPVILKAHYRVKHVDKGIEFAGLKILRCCEHCDIVGTIKGTKEFKGAHWHCYKCRNGFTRRDEAIKHYRTHFRNPSTTFQIQVAQDINQSAYTTKDAENRLDNSSQDAHLMQTSVSSASIDMSGVISIQPNSPLEAAQAESQQLEKSHSGEIQVSVAANETVDACDGQTIMIIQETTEEGQVVGTVESVHTAVSAFTHNNMLVSVTDDLNATADVQDQVQAAIPVLTHSSIMKPPPKPETPRVTGHWRQEKSLLELQLREIKAENSMLVMEKEQLQEQYEAQHENMKAQLDVANQDILAYQKREAELLNQLKIPLDDRINDLLMDLKNQHEELLHHQLAQLRRMYMHQLEDELGAGPKPDHDTQMISAKDVEMSIVRSVAGETIGTVIATGSGAGNVVLAAPEVYATLPSSALNAGNIVLTSETLMGDANQSSPLFVMSQSTLQDIKTEDHVHMDNTQTVIIEEALMEGDDPGTSLEEYTGEEQQQVLSSDGEHISAKILLGATVGSDEVSSHLELSEKSDTIEISLNEDIDIQNIPLTRKRKLDDDSREHSETKHQREND